MGAADGKFMVCAFLAGAQRVVEIEFAENLGYQMVLEAAKRRIQQQYDIQFNLHWIGSAIEEVRRFSCLSSCSVYSVIPQALTYSCHPAFPMSSRKPIFRLRLLE